MPDTVFAGDRISLRLSGPASQLGGVALLDTRELVFEHVPFLGDHPRQELGIDSEFRCPAPYRERFWAVRIFDHAVLA
jgi:hypothetical protein